VIFWFFVDYHWFDLRATVFVQFFLLLSLATLFATLIVIINLRFL
jgi:hypothetical protein